MTPQPYKGEERRQDPTSVRLALLEKAVENAKERDRTTQDSLVAVHKRISETRDKISTDVKEGFKDVGVAVAAVMDKIEGLKTLRAEEKKAQDIVCKDCSDALAALKENRNWMYAWVATAWAAIIGLGGWVFKHASNVDGETASHAISAVKKLKGGG